MQETQLIAEIKQRNNAAFAIIYKFYYPVVENFVKKNSGTADDAKDIFQETVLVLLDKVPQSDFQLTSSLKTYVFSIASNLWLKRLRDASKTVKGNLPYEPAEDSISAMEQHEESFLRQNFVKRVLRQVTKPCVQLLSRIFLNEIKREILMLQLGYKNTHSFDNQKYKCLEQARKHSK